MARLNARLVVLPEGGIEQIPTFDEAHLTTAAGELSEKGRAAGRRGVEAIKTKVEELKK